MLRWEAAQGQARRWLLFRGMVSVISPRFSINNRIEPVKDFSPHLVAALGGLIKAVDFETRTLGKHPNRKRFYTMWAEHVPRPNSDGEIKAWPVVEPRCRVDHVYMAHSDGRTGLAVVGTVATDHANRSRNVQDAYAEPLAVGQVYSVENPAETLALPPIDEPDVPAGTIFIAPGKCLV